MTSGTETIHREIVARLEAVRREENVARAAGGLLFTIAVSGAGILLALLLEEVFYFNPPVRSVLFWTLVLIPAGMLAYRVAPPLLRLFRIVRDQDDIATAGRVGRAMPQIGDRLVNTLQLFQEASHSRFFSTELVEAAIEDTSREVEGIDLTSIVNHSFSRTMARLAGGVGCLALLLLFVSPGGFFGSAQRLWNHGEVFAAPIPFSLIVTPGDKEVVKGEDVTVAVRIDGPAPDELLLRTRQEGESGSETTALTISSDGVFRHELRALRASTVYTVAAGPVTTRQYTLSVVDRPTVKRLRILLLPPPYTGLPPQQLDDNIGDITALAGTKAGITVESSKELTEAEIALNDSSTIPLQVRGPMATGTILLRRECSYHLRLLDHEGTGNADPVEYTVHLVADAFPTVSIVVPGANVDIADNSALPLVIKIADDYGFSRLRLAYRLIQSKYEPPAVNFTFLDIPISKSPGNEALVPYTWSLTSLGLVPEDVVSYYTEVFDNDRVTGPKSAVSETFTLRLPSLDEVFQDVGKSHETSVEGMHKALEQANEVKKGLEDLQQELRKEEQKLDWQSQKKVEDLARKSEEIKKTLEDVNRTVDRMLEEMQKNQLLSQETLEKYKELQQLMADLNSPELTDALKKLQQSMQQMSPEAMKQALQQLSFSEENFRKSLERTINLIKRLQIEAKVDELARRTEEMLKQQNDLSERTEKTTPQDQQTLSDISRRQQGMRDELERLRRESDTLQKNMQMFPREMPLDEMRKAQDSLDAGSLDEQMEQIQAELSKQDPGSAAHTQRQAAQKLGAAARQMRGVKEAMRRNQQQQAAGEMRRATQDLLELSQRQEELKNESQNLEPNSPGFRDNAKQQMEILRDLGNVTDNMSALAQKSFGVTPEMGKAVGDAMREMGDAMRSLEQRNGSAASQQQGAAMGSLNEAAQMMQNALSAMMQPGGQGIMGMSGFMQRLQQMAQQQGEINNATKNLGGLTPEQAAAMGRLAGEQGMVRKSLEQLKREASAAGQLNRMLGDLGSLAQEMREVQTDLAQGSVTPETLRRQERILSRLLDSQRSMNERDFENRRRAETGKQHPGGPPPRLDLTTQEGRNRLRQDLLKALQEGYARDYEELIRKYFEALEQQENTGQH